jgi:hypothetical protein
MASRRRERGGRRKLCSVDLDRLGKGRVQDGLRLDPRSQPKNAMGTHSSSTETPQGKPWGETESRFGGVCRVKAIGQTVQGTPTADAWSFGLRRRSSLTPALLDWRTILTPGDVRTSIAVLHGLGASSKAIRINPSPGASLHPAGSCRRCVRLLTKTVHPSDQWTKHSAYPRPA